MFKGVTCVTHTPIVRTLALALSHLMSAAKHDDPRDSSLEAKFSSPKTWFLESSGLSSKTLNQIFITIVTTAGLNTSGMFLSGLIMVTRNRYVSSASTSENISITAIIGFLLGQPFYSPSTVLLTSILCAQRKEILTVTQVCCKHCRCTLGRRRIFAMISLWILTNFATAYAFRPSSHLTCRSLSSQTPPHEIPFIYAVALHNVICVRIGRVIPPLIRIPPKSLDL